MTSCGSKEPIEKSMDTFATQLFDANNIINEKVNYLTEDEKKDVKILSSCADNALKEISADVRTGDNIILRGIIYGIYSDSICISPIDFDYQKQALIFCYIPKEHDQKYRLLTNGDAVVLKGTLACTGIYSFNLTLQDCTLTSPDINSLTYDNNVAEVIKNASSISPENTTIIGTVATIHETKVNPSDDTYDHSNYADDADEFGEDAYMSSHLMVLLSDDKTDNYIAWLISKDEYDRSSDYYSTLKEGDKIILHSKVAVYEDSVVANTGEKFFIIE